MARKKGKSVSFDAMVKFFMKNYGIPTKRDVDMLVARLDRLESLVKTAMGFGRSRRAIGSGAPTGKAPRRKTAITASDTVLETISKFKKGAGFAEIQSKTGFGEKKLRNIIFRLDKLGKIKRVSRGIYAAK